MPYRCNFMEEQRVLRYPRKDKIKLACILVVIQSVCQITHSNIDLNKKTVKRKENKTRQKSLCVFSSSCYMLSVSFTVWGGLHLEINEKKSAPIEAIVYN